MHYIKTSSVLSVSVTGFQNGVLYTQLQIFKNTFFEIFNSLYIYLKNARRYFYTFLY